MTPLVERELRAALGKGGARRLWVISASIAGVLSLGFLGVMILFDPQVAGRTLFRWLYVLGLGSVAYYGLRVTADLFSQERREGTLGLLYLSGLGTPGIFCGKLLAATLTCAYNVMVAVPFFAVPFLTGGVTLTDFGCALASLANGLLFSLALGTLASVVCRDGSMAFVLAAVVGGLLCLGVPAYEWVRQTVSQAGPVDPAWRGLSPAAGPWMVFKTFEVGTVRAFWANAAVTLGVSVSALLVAGWVLHRTWKEEMNHSWLSRWWERWLGWFQGNKDWRLRLRRELLDRDPVAWLAARDRRAVLAAKAFVASVMLVWVGGWLSWPGGWLRAGNFFLTAFVLHSGLTALVVHSAARCLGEERRSGGLELLLATPLSAEQIVAGQRAALRRQFGALLLTLLLIDAVFLAVGLWRGGYGRLANVTYTILWVFIAAFFHVATGDLSKCAMWISLWTGRPGFATLQSATMYGWASIWLMVVLGRTLHGSFPSGSLGELIFVVFLLGALVFYLPGRLEMERKLKEDLRWIAAEPIPAPNDPRFRGWNMTRIMARDSE